jgi:hypothetical protein
LHIISEGLFSPCHAKANENTRFGVEVTEEVIAEATKSGFLEIQLHYMDQSIKAKEKDIWW